VYPQCNAVRCDSFALYLSDPDGRHERSLLANSGSNYNASFSLDGHWIVFTSERFGSADIFRVHPDGSGLERLTDNQWEEGVTGWVPPASAAGIR
jgi:Tol biopolymer transport system component